MRWVRVIACVGKGKTKFLNGARAPSVLGVMSNWTPVIPANVPPPKGPYSPAVRAGDFVYVSGQTPRNPVSGELVGNDISTQTRQTLSNVQRILAQAGAGMKDVVSVTIYLADVDDWTAMNAVYTEFFSSPYPSRTAVGSSLRDIMVEISVVAYVRP
jgi:2-iminobutanoate/2-iminopropanoate deaminase